MSSSQRSCRCAWGSSRSPPRTRPRPSASYESRSTGSDTTLEAELPPGWVFAREHPPVRGYELPLLPSSIGDRGSQLEPHVPLARAAGDAPPVSHLVDHEETPS